MKSDVQPHDAVPEKLKSILHCKIEQMRPDQLALLDRVLLQIEVVEIADRLSEAFEEDQRQGKLDRIPELIERFRRAHPYR